jgi:hypothetical protein
MSFRPLGFRILVAVLIMAVGLAIFHHGRTNPQDVPWGGITLADRVGRFTSFKLDKLREDLPACRALLDTTGQRYAVLPPIDGGFYCGYRDGIRFDRGGGAPFSPPAATSCVVAAALFLWQKQVIDPAAERHFGSRIVQIDTFGSYNCRGVRGGREGRWSEHATANAIDIAGFRLADGRRITIAGDWSRDDARGHFLHDVRDGACPIFSTTLSPDYDAAHRDHLHLDRGRRGGWTYCR